LGITKRGMQQLKKYSRTTSTLTFTYNPNNRI